MNRSISPELLRSRQYGNEQHQYRECWCLVKSEQAVKHNQHLLQPTEVNMLRLLGNCVPMTLPQGSASLAVREVNSEKHQFDLGQSTNLLM